MRRKIVVLILMLILSTSSIAVDVASSSSTLSTPETSVAIVDRSYDVPLKVTYSTDPYTGKQVQSTNGGYHVTNRTVEVTIKNQPFTPTTVDGNTTSLFYIVRTKGHYGTDWSEHRPVAASSSVWTVIIYVLGSEGWIFSDGDVIDFEVEAVAGYYYVYYGGHVAPISTGVFGSAVESGWSSTQAITIADSATASVTPSPSTTPINPTNPVTISPTSTSNHPVSGESAFFGTGWLGFVVIVLLVIIAVLLVFVVFYLRKRSVNAKSSPF
jgi:hypothetical protein